MPQTVFKTGGAIISVVGEAHEDHIRKLIRRLFHENQRLKKVVKEFLKANKRDANCCCCSEHNTPHRRGCFAVKFERALDSK